MSCDDDPPTTTHEHHPLSSLSLPLALPRSLSRHPSSLALLCTSPSHSRSLAIHPQDPSQECQDNRLLSPTHPNQDEGTLPQRHRVARGAWGSEGGEAGSRTRDTLCGVGGDASGVCSPLVAAATQQPLVSHTHTHTPPPRVYRRWWCDQPRKGSGCRAFPHAPTTPAASQLCHSLVPSIHMWCTAPATRAVRRGAAAAVLHRSRPPRTSSPCAAATTPTGCAHGSGSAAACAHRRRAAAVGTVTRDPCVSRDVTPPPAPSAAAGVHRASPTPIHTHTGCRNRQRVLTVACLLRLRCRNARAWLMCRANM